MYNKHMDDLKIFTSSEERFRTYIEKGHNFSSSINVTFDLEKCAKPTLIKRKVR